MNLNKKIMKDPSICGFHIHAHHGLHTLLFLFTILALLHSSLSQATTTDTFASNPPTPIQSANEPALLNPTTFAFVPLNPPATKPSTPLAAPELPGEIISVPTIPSDQIKTEPPPKETTPIQKKDSPLPKKQSEPTILQIQSDPKLLVQHIITLAPASTSGQTAAQKPGLTSEEWNTYTREEKYQYLLKVRQDQVNQETTQALKDYQDGRSDLSATHARLMKMTDTYGLSPKDKEVQTILARFREAAKTEEFSIMHTATTTKKTYEQLTQAERAMFSYKPEEYNKAQEVFSQTRNALVQTSAGMFDSSGRLIQVYDAKSWESMRKDEQAYFGNTRTEFIQAQRTFAAQTRISPAENDYLIKRQEYISESAFLSTLKNERASAKTPGDKQRLEALIATQQSKVDNAYTSYVELQSDALIAAYTRKADQLKTEIESLDQTLGTLEAGPQRREIEQRIATKMADQRQLEFKARDLLGTLTFAERLNQFVTTYSEYSGLGQYSSLFISDKDLSKRRKEAEDAFCDTILLGGTNCWASKICQDNIDATIGGTGVVSSTATGEPRGAVRIQADKGQPAIISNETTHTDTALFLYHAEYYIQNTNEDRLMYNIVFYATQGPPLRAFVKDKELAPGATESRLRTNAIARYSQRDYTTVCITLNPGITRFDGSLAREVCTGITLYTGGPTSIPGAIPTPTEQAANNGGTNAGGPGARPPQDFDGF